MCVNQNQDGGMQGSADAVRASTYHNVWSETQTNES